MSQKHALDDKPRTELEGGLDGGCCSGRVHRGITVLARTHSPPSRIVASISFRG
jgi:hypothetical protein